MSDDGVEDVVARFAAQARPELSVGIRRVFGKVMNDRKGMSTFLRDTLIDADYSRTERRSA